MIGPDCIAKLIKMSRWNHFYRRNFIRSTFHHVFVRVLCFFLNILSLFHAIVLFVRLKFRIRQIQLMAEVLVKGVLCFVLIRPFDNFFVLFLCTSKVHHLCEYKNVFVLIMYIFRSIKKLCKMVCGLEKNHLVATINKRALKLIETKMHLVTHN